jgi:hypothetical protein
MSCSVLVESKAGKVLGQVEDAWPAWRVCACVAVQKVCTASFVPRDRLTDWIVAC